MKHDAAARQVTLGVWIESKGNEYKKAQRVTQILLEEIAYCLSQVPEEERDSFLRWFSKEAGYRVGTPPGAI